MFSIPGCVRFHSMNPEQISIALAEPQTGLHFANVVLRTLLSLVALSAGVGKLLDLEGGRQSMSDFGVPSKWVPAAAHALPILEIVLALGLLLDVTSRVAGLGLAFLFTLFGLGIWNLLRQEKTPPCHCFGAVHSEPVSRGTLLRAVGLAASALLCSFLPLDPLTPDWGSTLLTVLGFTLVGFGVQKGATRFKGSVRNLKKRRLEEGQRIPAVRVASGAWLEALLPEGKRTLLLFTSRACGPCKVFKFFLATWVNSVAHDLKVIEISLLAKGEQPESIAELEHAIETYYLKSEDFRRFKSPTPGALLVDEAGTILSPPVTGAEEIEALVRAALGGFI